MMITTVYLKSFSDLFSDEENIVDNPDTENVFDDFNLNGQEEKPIILIEF